VTDRRGTTAIPRSINAWLELAADGELLASDDINTVNAHFTTTSAGLDVFDAGTTLVAYGGTDPVQLAAITGIDALTSGPLPCRAQRAALPRRSRCTSPSCQRTATISTSRPAACGSPSSGADRLTR
jgi:hypothetical protein